MHKLIEYVCDELEDLEEKVAREHKLSSTEVQYMDLLAHAKKNLLKGEEMSEGGYSGRPYYDGGTYRDGGSYRGDSYDRSYARRRDSMGRFSRRYSGDNGMVESLKDLMEDAPDERTRAELQRMISRMENM